MILILITLIVLLYGARKFNYWKKRGVKHDYPLPYFGNNFKQFVQKRSICMMATEMYRKYPNEKVVGFFRSTAPELVIRDPVLVKRILVTDFQHFYARGFNPHKKYVEPLMQNLFFADGDLWRLLRKRFGQAFSTAKIKGMFYFITNKAEKLQLLADEISNLDYYDMRELMARYATDFIGACGFGVNMDALNNNDSEFRRLGKRIFHRTPRDAIVYFLKLVFPNLCKNLHVLAPDLTKSVHEFVKTVINERDGKPSGKNDFIDLMLKYKQRGEIVVESLEQKHSNGLPKLIRLEMSDLLLTAQAFVFFGAGFETSSTAASFTLHQLAYHEDCQIKVQEEIDRVLNKYDNKITYEAINEMSYLEKVFYEAMRMYPAVGFLMRKCTSPMYTFPEIGLTINKGVKVVIPVQAFHNDEQYFPEPDKFDPERFTNIKHNISNCIYLPFGDGPRTCVAARLGKLLVLAGVVAILQKFSVKPCAKSSLKPIPDPMATISESFIGGLPLKLIRRN